ncbi:hypothetical protein [Leekyejoonella antrihumi]|uniref:Uncharacterized protein n=1 Tax=Leekyejoonella antrihumi TaxID=1660198 RepID=A0A563DPD4_9MICO|nr:hypothetical protein [Leekyejoonella antrihumi]TWP32065.1 hypothetical protein FGL98_24730 [Leekyejoonella antrihumi]
MGRFGGHRSIAALTSVLLIAALSLVAAPRAAAEACDARNNLQTGWASNFWNGTEPRSYEGVSAVILDRGGYVLCSTDTNGGWNFSTTWTMIVSNNLNGYAQSGTMYRFGYGTCVKRWAEQNSGSSWADYYISGCSNVGESHKYWQSPYYTGSAWTMRSNIDTTLIHQSTFDPFAVWTRPFYVQYSAETYHSESHIPGTSTAKQDFSSMLIQDFYNNGWYGSCSNVYLGSYNGNPSRWGVDAPACNHVRMWTAR